MGRRAGMQAVAYPASFDIPFPRIARGQQACRPDAVRSRNIAMEIAQAPRPPAPFDQPETRDERQATTEPDCPNADS